MIAGLALAFAASHGVRESAAQLFTDDLSTGANWNVVQDVDASAVFGFDYSTKGVPAAPNGSDTVGLKFEVNNGDATTGAEQIGAFATVASLPTQFTFRVDAWINWAPDEGSTGAGTTEFIGVSVGHDEFEAGPWGASFLYTSDGDTSTDYRMYKDGTHLQSESGQYAVGSEAGARNSSNPIISEAFPEIDIATAVPTQGTTGTQQAGAGGFQWMTLNLEVDTQAIGPSGISQNPGTVKVSMKSATSGNVLEVGTVDYSNTDDGYTYPQPGFEPDLTQSVGLLMSDLFSSVTLDPNVAFGLFDNVQVLSGLHELVPDETGGLPGDYNEDGSVDAADYTVWRDALGGTESLPNDDTAGVGADDYDRWVAAYGDTEMGPSAGAAAPEPAAFGLALAACSLACASRRRK